MSKILQKKLEGKNEGTFHGLGPKYFRDNVKEFARQIQPPSCMQGRGHRRASVSPSNESNSLWKFQSE